MFRSPQHQFRGFGFVALALSVAVFVTAFAGPAGAYADGYNLTAGNAQVTAAFWDQNSNGFVVNPAFTQLKPNAVRAAFDSTWTSMQSTFCDQLEAGIKAGDSSWNGRNSCNPVPAAQAQLLFKNLGTNLVGLRYYLPGHDGEEYSYNHQGCFAGICANFNIAVSYDLVIDVVLRVAAGVGPETDTTTPISVQSAQLNFSNSFFRTTGTIGCGDDCTAADKKLDSAVVDLTNQIGMSDTNTQLHAGIALLPGYYGLGANADANGLNLALRGDILPKADPNLPLSTATYNVSFGRFLLPIESLWAVDTGGALWQQAGAFGFGHWFNDKQPSGTKLVSGPATAIGSDQSRQVFATAANGHVYDFNGTQWQDRGLPPSTTAVGTPAAGANGTLARVVVRGANGHIEMLMQNSATAWQWTDLGSPGGTTTFNPAINVAGGYMALAVTLPNGHVAVKEYFGAVSSPWRDLGAFGAAAASGPSLMLNAGTMNAYVTDANGAVEVASFGLFGAATISGIPALLFNTLPTAAGTPSVSMLNGHPTIFVTDTAGNTWQMTYSTISFGRFTISGYGATNFGTLLGSTMRPPTVLNAFGNVLAFAVGANQHVGETHNFGSRVGLIDHMALSRVVYEAHAQRQIIVIGGASAPKPPTSSIVIRPVSEWGTVVNEGQTDTSQGITATYPDAFRFQSTQSGSVVCQAYVETVGWTAEVSDGQPCGSLDQAHAITAIRLRLADAPAGMHIAYRCWTGIWSPWEADGEGCGATNFNQAVTAMQVQYSDTAVPEISSRSYGYDGTWQPWANDGATIGVVGDPIEGIEVHSNVGGNLRCAAYTSSPISILGSDGWHLGVDDNSVCGNVYSFQSIKAFRLFLSGGPAGEHIEYRAYVDGQGWTDWQSDGNVVGTPSNSAAPIDQIQVQAFR
jgi:hypothetical protein